MLVDEEFFLYDMAKVTDHPNSTESAVFIVNTTGANVCEVHESNKSTAIRKRRLILEQRYHENQQ